MRAEQDNVNILALRQFGDGGGVKLEIGFRIKQRAKSDKAQRVAFDDGNANHRRLLLRSEFGLCSHRIVRVAYLDFAQMQSTKAPELRRFSNASFRAGLGLL